jgi:membrane protease YdiL (CAAX protease family)
MKNFLYTIKNEILIIKKELKKLNSQTIIIFLSILVLQIFSFYYARKKIFRENFESLFSSSSYLPLYEQIYCFLLDFIIFFVFPLLIIKFLFKKKLTDYGLNLNNNPTGLKIAIITIVIMLPVIWVVSSLPGFQAIYPNCSMVRDSWTLFIIYEMCCILYMFSWEFIWRGFTLFGLEKIFGFYAIFIQMIPFTILHNGKPTLETFSSIIAGFFLGCLAIRTRSILYGLIIHIAVIFMIDIISIIRYKTQVFGIGFYSIIDMFKL